MKEENIDLSTTERQLLYDIRSEMRTANGLLSKQLEALCAIAKHTEPKEVVKPKIDKITKPKVTLKPKAEKPKRGKKDV